MSTLGRIYWIVASFAFAAAQSVFFAPHAHVAAVVIVAAMDVSILAALCLVGLAWRRERKEYLADFDLSDGFERKENDR